MWCLSKWDCCNCGGCQNNVFENLGVVPDGFYKWGYTIGELFKCGCFKNIAAGFKMSQSGRQGLKFMAAMILTCCGQSCLRLQFLYHYFDNSELYKNIPRYTVAVLSLNSKI